MNPLVSVCIVHYGAVDFLKRVIDSVKRSTYRNFEVIVIDNNGESHAPLSPHELGLADIRHVYMRNLENKGFAKACNQGLRLSAGDYIFILNNDIEVDRDCIRILVKAAHSDPDVAVVQPKMLDFYNRNAFHSSAAGGFLDIFGYPFARGRMFDHAEHDSGQYDNAVEIIWASGAALFGRRKALLEAGSFDSDFFMYMEEIDLAWRLLLQGHKAVYIPSTAIYHVGCPHLNRENETRMYFNHRNSLVMLLKNLSLVNLFVLFPLRICLDFATICGSLLFLKISRARAVLKAFWYIVRNFPSIQNKRYAVQSRRKVSDSAVLSLLYPYSVALAYYVMKKKRMSDLPHIKTKEYACAAPK